jgi:hypothetical protein
MTVMVRPVDNVINGIIFQCLFLKEYLVRRKCLQIVICFKAHSFMEIILVPLTDDLTNLPTYSYHGATIELSIS